MTTIPTEPSMEWLTLEVATLRAELAQLRHQLRREVRTRRLVVVDGGGEERVTTHVGPDKTYLTVSAPGPESRENRATAQMEAVHGESDDLDGEPIGFASVNVSARGYTGAWMLAHQIDNRPAFGPDGVEEVVDGEFRVFDKRNHHATVLKHGGIEVER